MISVLVNISVGLTGVHKTYTATVPFSFDHQILSTALSNTQLDHVQGSKVSLGAGNYHQPQLPSANMADSVVGTERYSLFMQILSTHFGFWGLYTTEYHVCTYWTPPFDLRIATFAARRWEKRRRDDGNLQYGMMVITNSLPWGWW